MDPVELLKEAQLLLVDGKDKESIEAFTKAIEAGADPYISHLSRGVAYVKLKDADNALNDFEKAINANNRSPRAYFYRGMIHMMRKDYENSIKDFSRAIELKPGYGMAKFSRAISYARLGNLEEASKDMMAVMPQMEENLQSFADSYGIVRTEMWEVMSQMSGESGFSPMGLNAKAVNILRKWLEVE